MFYTPKPRQFHYEPRTYDPKKEEWEALKRKYAAKEAETETAQPTVEQSALQADELAYFENRVKQLDRKEKQAAQKFGWKDLVRKREMPKFNYQSRFGNGTTETTAASTNGAEKRKMKRRFDISDSDYMKPVSAGKIMMYALVATLLLIWILF